MRIALSPATPGLTASELVALTQEAEGLGYDSAWLAEVAGPEAFALAGAIAAATSRLDLGIAVVPAATRSPALLAMAAATISQLAPERRVSLGIGASSRVIVERWHGREFDPPLGVVRDTVEMVRALLTGERGGKGRLVSAEGFRAAVLPIAPVGLFVGALGPKMLGLAGEVGDGVCLNLMPVAAVPRQIAEIEAGAERAGRVLSGFETIARFQVVVSEDLDEARGVIRAAFGPYFGQPVYNRFLAWCGWPEEAAAIAAGFAAGDREAVARALHDRLIDEITLLGAPGRIREHLARFADAGVDVAALNLLAPDAAAVAAGLRSLAPAG